MHIVRQERRSRVSKQETNKTWKITSVVRSRTLKLRALSDVTVVSLPKRPVELPPAGRRRAFGRSRRSWGWYSQERVALAFVNVTHPAENHLVRKFLRDCRNESQKSPTSLQVYSPPSKLSHWYAVGSRDEDQPVAGISKLGVVG